MRRKRTYLIVLISLMARLSLAAADYHSLPPLPQSEQCIVSTPMEAAVVMEQSEISYPSSPTSFVNRSRRNIFQLTNPMPVTYAQYVYHSFAKPLQAKLYRKSWLIINLPSEQISFPFHSFW